MSPAQSVSIKLASIFLRWLLVAALVGLPCTLTWAQTVGRPLREKSAAPLAPQAAPLAPQKMEEALRMLLRADSVQSLRQRARLGPESSGLIVDQTITKIGHDFYDQFFSHWEPPSGYDDFTITVNERPARGNNAIVALTVNETDLLEFPLQSKYDLIEEGALQAIDIVKNFLQEEQNVSRQLERGNKQAIEAY
ncbi:MAG TPA: CsgE family curli-type amyloid fiber assembly protein [Hymenobacter sp.]|uniref:CsgE family curli-type amyloid fiber assembly protein n=1 Tax=Hymenobacter sp. TaxID=1898978 RepID=UPI002ED90816